MTAIGKKFINEVTDCVDDSIKGFICINPGLQYHEEHRLVTKATIEVTSQVGLISGGGSGHEPFCTGYVGDGMLAGAVAGNIFASPPKSHILHAIRYLNQFYKGGILVIIPNYTGDCLNFGMAVESARNENLKVDAIVIGEDCASGKNLMAGRRGMCGLLYTYKIGGALAAEGKSLGDITHTIQEVLQSMSTLGITSQACSLPGNPPLFNVADDEMELGTGVHGEAGIRKLKFSSAKTAVSIVLEELYKSMSELNGNSSVVVLLNNLGTNTELEQNIISNEIHLQLAKKGVSIKRMYAGNLMTSLNMSGFQISILNLNDENRIAWLNCLDKETSAPRWVGTKMSIFVKSNHNVLKNVLITPQDNIVSSQFVLSENQITLFKKCLSSASECVIENESKLNELDSGCGDGDCGSTLRCLAEGVQQMLKINDFKCPANVLQTLSDIAESKMGGTSGAIYSLCFSSMRKHFLDVNDETLSLTWAQALQIGVKTIKKYGHAEQGDRTIIDALEPAAEMLLSSIKNNCTLKDALNEALSAAKKGCEATKRMKARAGRASYVSEEHLTKIDAGAYGFVLCLSAINACF